jgi:hypothetical protein
MFGLLGGKEYTGQEEEREEEERMAELSAASYLIAVFPWDK